MVFTRPINPWAHMHLINLRRMLTPHVRWSESRRDSNTRHLRVNPCPVPPNQIFEIILTCSCDTENLRMIL